MSGTARRPIRPRRTGFRAARVAARPRRWRAGWWISRWGRIPAARCASRRAIAGCSASARRYGAISLAGRLRPGAELRHVRLVRALRCVAGRGGRGAAGRPAPRRRGPSAAPRGSLGERPAGRGRGVAPGAGEAGANPRPRGGGAHRAGGDRQLLRPFPHRAGGGSLDGAGRLGGGDAASVRPRHRRALRRGEGDRSGDGRARAGRSAGCCRRASGRCWPAGR